MGFTSRFFLFYSKLWRFLGTLHRHESSMHLPNMAGARDKGILFLQQFNITNNIQREYERQKRNETRGKKLSTYFQEIIDVKIGKILNINCD